MDDDDDFFRPEFDLGEFRHAAARYVKLLIRARWKCEPKFLSTKALREWGLSNIEKDRFSASQLMRQAADALGELNDRFLPRCGSGGVSPTDDSTPEGRLISELSFLATPEGGAPYHNRALNDAAAALESGRPVNWGELVSWQQLPQIREDLNKLPHLERAVDISSGLGAEFLGSGRYRVVGEELCFEGQQAKALAALVQLRSATKQSLVDKSGVEDAPRVLRMICKKFPQLAPFIRLPGKKGAGGYSTSIIDARPPSS